MIVWHIHIDGFLKKYMEKSRILIVTPSYLPLLGGMEEQCYQLAKEFLAKNYVVDILTEQTLENFPLEENMEGVLVHRMKKPNRSSIFSYLRLAKDIFDYLRKNRDYKFIIIRTFTLHGLVTGFLKYFNILKIKTFITADTGGENDELDFLGKSIFKKILVLFFRAHDYINSISEINYTKLVKLGFPTEKITRISNGVDCREYDNSHYPEKINNFLFLAQLKKEKGLYELLAAFEKVIKKYPNSKLYIGGDGQEKENLIDHIEKKSLAGNIIYIGRINGKDRKAFYQKGECLVLPSYSEGFGLVYAEAAVMKRAIIATEVADLKQNFGDNIVFCKKRDTEDLCEKIIWMIEKFKKEDINYNEVIKKFDIKEVVNKILKLA